MNNVIKKIDRFLSYLAVILLIVVVMGGGIVVSLLWYLSLIFNK